MINQSLTDDVYTKISSASDGVSLPEHDQFDLIAMVAVDTSTQSYSISTWKTIEFRNKLISWALEKDRDIFELKSVTTWQKKCLDYQSVYNAYLLGSLTEEEFEKDSDEYTTEIRNISKNEILSTFARLNRLLEFHISTSDLASYLQTDSSSVSDALESKDIQQDLTTLQSAGKYPISDHSN
jgi:hypothetical protein